MVDSIGPITSQLRACSQYRYDRAVAALARSVDAVRDLLTPDSTGSANERAWLDRRGRTFERAQAAWQAYRDAACDAVYEEVFPGTFAAIHRSECLERLTRQRMAELQWTYFAMHEAPP